MSILASQGAAGESKIDWQAEAYLQDDLDQLTVAAVVTKPGRARALVRDLGLQGYDVFDSIDTVLIRAAARNLLEWQDRDEIQLIDPIDSSLVGTVTSLLRELCRLILYDDLGSFHPTVLNLSLGVPRQLIGKGLSGDRAVHRVLELIIARHGIPVIMSAGNDGPEPGLVNPWALAQGVFVVGAADEKGTHLWTQSSRFQIGGAAGRAFFLAWGEDTIGALPIGMRKTPAELEAEGNVDLAAIVGPQNIEYYSVDSGTSFAAASLSRIICLIHQCIASIQARASSMTPVMTEVTLEPFIRAIVDTAIDRTHPAFANRLVDERKHFGSPYIELQPGRKQQFWDIVTKNGIDIRLRYTPSAVLQFLRRAARPISGMSSDSVGSGFVSWSTVATSLTTLRMSDLVDMFAEPGDPRLEAWQNSLNMAGNPFVFDSKEVSDFDQYCQKYDLILSLPLTRPAAGR